MKLLKHQKAEISEFLTQNHFKVSDFDYQEPDPTWGTPSETTMRFKQEPLFYFSIGSGVGCLYRARMTPGVRVRDNDFYESDNWSDIMSQIRKWLVGMLDEILNPDPWANLKGAAAPEFKDEKGNSLLSLDEQKHILKLGEDIVALLKKGNENDERIIEAIGVIGRNVATLGRVDIFRAALGALITLGLQGVVSSVDSHTAYNMLLEGFSYVKALGNEAIAGLLK